MITVPRAGLRGKAEAWALPTHPHPQDPRAVESKCPFLPLPYPYTLLFPLVRLCCLPSVKHEISPRKDQHGQALQKTVGRRARKEA